MHRNDTSIPAVHEPYDLTRPPFEQLVDGLRSTPQVDRPELSGLEGATYIAAGTALKCLASEVSGKRLQTTLTGRRTGLDLYVVTPAYHESKRMSPRTDDNPQGEDAFNFRLRRLDRLATLFPAISPHLIIVDDGCDGNGDPTQRSQVVAERLYSSYRQQYPDSPTQVTITNLDALIDIQEQLEWQPGIASSTQSRKGGSVLGGMALALHIHKDSSNDFVVVESDTDLSVHPDQILLLADKVVRENAAAAIGSRRMPDSVAIIDAARDVRGQEFIQSWKQLLPSLAPLVTDTNRGLKAYSQQAAQHIIEHTTHTTFAYQIETLLLLARAGMKICEVGISYIDSVALSTLTGEDAQQAYADMLRNVRELSEQYHELTASE